MSTLNWKLAQVKLETMLNGKSQLDVYFLMNIVAPLRSRLANGERSLRLYNEIMNIRLHYAKVLAIKQ